MKILPSANIWNPNNGIEVVRGRVVDVPADYAAYLVENMHAVYADGQLAYDTFDATNGAIAYANENNIDLLLVTGTGPNGRIYLADVKAYNGEK